jgi:hypothetical protein
MARRPGLRCGRGLDPISTNRAASSLSRDDSGLLTSVPTDDARFVHLSSQATIIVPQQHPAIIARCQRQCGHQMASTSRTVPVRLPGRTSNWFAPTAGGASWRPLENAATLDLYGFTPDGKRLAYTELNPETGGDTSTLPVDSSDPQHSQRREARTVSPHPIY